MDDSKKQTIHGQTSYRKLSDIRSILNTSESSVYLLFTTSMNKIVTVDFQVEDVVLMLPYKQQYTIQKSQDLYMLATKCDVGTYNIEVSSPEAILCTSNDTAHMSAANCPTRLTGNTSYTIKSPRFFTFVTILSADSNYNLTMRQHLTNTTLNYNSTSFIKVYTHELCHTINYFMPPQVGEDLTITQEVKNETHREDSKMSLVDASTGELLTESHHLVLEFPNSKEVMVVSTSTFSDPIQPYDYDPISFLDLWIVIAP